MELAPRAFGKLCPVMAAADDPETLLAPLELMFPYP